MRLLTHLLGQKLSYFATQKPSLPERLLRFDSSMGLGSSSPEDMDQLEETKQVVKELIDCDEIVIFSKTTCPYCKSAKGVFDTMQCKYTAVELDDRADGYTIQNILEQMTGARTVPRIFVRGECLGGCSDIKELYNSGKLAEILRAK